ALRRRRAVSLGEILTVRLNRALVLMPQLPGVTGGLERAEPRTLTLPNAARALGLEPLASRLMPQRPSDVGVDGAQPHRLTRAGREHRPKRLVARPGAYFVADHRTTTASRIGASVGNGTSSKVGTAVGFGTRFARPVGGFGAAGFATFSSPFR